eukprot:1278505-Amphidinium_carterae.1
MRKKQSSGRWSTKYPRTTKQLGDAPNVLNKRSCHPFTRARIPDSCSKSRIGGSVVMRLKSVHTA